MIRRSLFLHTFALTVACTLEPFSLFRSSNDGACCRAVGQFATVGCYTMVRTALAARAAGTLQTPEQFLGFKVGADNKLARWDTIVDYMKLAAANSDRVRFRELGKTSSNNPFIALEISAP